MTPRVSPFKVIGTDTDRSATFHSNLHRTVPFPFLTCTGTTFNVRFAGARMFYCESFLYRATLCVSAVFAVARVSVCPSVTFVYCIHTAEDIVKLL